jgi:ribose transport system substrate-binding protein
MVNCFNPDVSSPILAQRKSLMRNLLGAFACLLVLAGCNGAAKPTSEDKVSTATQTGQSGKKLKIAVVPKGTSHVFWNSVHAGAERAAKELGVEVIWKGPLLENDRAGQMDTVQDFVAKRVDGICLAPLDKQALVGPVRESVEAGIPVVVFDSALQDESKIVSYVATDNRKGGELAARQMGKILGGKGNVILLRYASGSESTEQREEGFLDALKSEFPEINIISSNQYAGTTPEEALNSATQILKKYADTVSGIFAVCEPNANGVLIALKETQLAGKVKFIAFDPNEDLIRALADGSCHGIVLQDPVTMGYEAVKAVVKSIRGDKVDKRINTGETVATPENAKTPEIHKLLNPERV